MKMKKVKTGDGHSLKPYRFWHVFTRALFHLEIKNERDEIVTYAVNYTAWAEEPRADVYRNGKHMSYSKLPAIFPVENGAIEVAASSYGVNRMHYVVEGKEEFPLHPDKRSFRGFRKWVDKRFPRLSSFIGVSAVIILLASIVLGLPQLAETISKIPWVSENIGTFTSPFVFSFWVNFVLITAAVLAGTERALMLRNHWLIDIETNHWDS